MFMKSDFFKLWAEFKKEKKKKQKKEYFQVVQVQEILR